MSSTMNAESGSFDGLERGLGLFFSDATEGWMDGGTHSVAELTGRIAYLSIRNTFAFAFPAPA
jgi:hypothetical protein